MRNWIAKIVVVSLSVAAFAGLSMVPKDASAQAKQAVGAQSNPSTPSSGSGTCASGQYDDGGNCIIIRNGRLHSSTSTAGGTPEPSPTPLPSSVPNEPTPAQQQESSPKDSGGEPSPPSSGSEYKEEQSGCCGMGSSSSNSNG